MRSAAICVCVCSLLVASSVADNIISRMLRQVLPTQFTSGIGYDDFDADISAAASSDHNNVDSNDIAYEFVPIKTGESASTPTRPPQEPPATGSTDPPASTQPPGGGSDTSGWNPFTWFAPKLRDIPYNPDTDLTTCEIAARHGYQCEGHVVVTEDGYMLTMHRLPCEQIGCEHLGRRGSGQPVFLQHGLLSSSADWLLSGPEKALAFILADAGYDVWLGNARGNTYSKRHKTFRHTDSEFWDFTWHEMAYYDVPAEIDYLYKIRAMENPILNNATVPLYDLLYVGHSMGTTMAFALLSMRPEYNVKIKAGFALAPVAYMTKVKSPIRLLAPFSKDIQIFSVSDRINFANDILGNLRMPNWVDYITDTLFNQMSLSLLMIIKYLGANEFLPQNKVLQFLAKYGCEMTEAEKYICENTVFVLCGFDKAQYNETLMPVIFAHTPAGTSTKTVVHYAQEIHEKGNFQYFDYGRKTNVEKYGQDTPPQYDLSKVTAPFALFYAQNDWLAGPEDVGLLFDQLQHSAIGMFKVPFDSFNHVDFMWGKDAPRLLYTKILEVMAKFQPR